MRGKGKGGVYRGREIRENKGLMKGEWKKGWRIKKDKCKENKMEGDKKGSEGSNREPGIREVRVGVMG